jgi:serine/threonine protein phosphatase 1
MKRTFVIGDIHGGLKGLKEIMGLGLVKTEDRLIFLGDYVDGWSESAGVIHFLIQLSKIQECIFIKGNHDEWCEEWLRTGYANSDWLLHGGLATVQSYEGINEQEKEKQLLFFQQMKLFFIDEENRLFVHAGFTSLQGPEQEFPKYNLTRDRTLWEMALRIDKDTNTAIMHFSPPLGLFKEIFIGHTPTLNYGRETPMHAANVWDIDTGAAFTGRLTMMDIRSKAFWQSSNLKDLYPNEKGRN